MKQRRSTGAPTAAQKAGALQAEKEWAKAATPRRPFDDRGFSRRTIDALVARGIDAPERLLFATEAELKQIPGVGRASLGEIMGYRARFLPEPGAEPEEGAKAFQRGPSRTV
jgi:DNA-directed RNA polymerase alpha subunit